MEKDLSKNIRLGMFVFLATSFVVFGLYFIGSKQNLFGSTFRINAFFEHVHGLSKGSNIRFGGINVGTVEKVEIISDTSIKVVMLIKEHAREFIKKNSIAAIGTDGLMGNKLINIITSPADSDPVANEDVLTSVRPIETEEMLRTLNRTNSDVAAIAKNLKQITEKINSQKGIWSVLMDSSVAYDLRQSIVNIKLTSNNSAIVTGDLSNIVKDINRGKGALGALLTDTSIENKLHQTIVNIKLVSDSLAYITGDLREVSTKIRSGEGAIGTILMDTTFVHNLNKSMENIRDGSAGFNENMEALKHNFLLRNYFRKKERAKKDSL